jgi:8-oxo-dGTP pyrophosphatase MutT (NUDIX family)
MQWNPHLTVATIVEKNGRFLLVKEQVADQIVINQPAGHVEPFESLIDAAKRETLEETKWHIEITHFVGLYVYTASNGITYYRHCFAAIPVQCDENASLDVGILETLWLTAEEIKNQNALRSPLVLKCVEDYMNQQRFPLSLIYEHEKSM